MTDNFLYTLRHYINTGAINPDGLPFQEIHSGTLFECLEKATDYCGKNMPIEKAMRHGICIERSKL